MWLKNEEGRLCGLNHFKYACRSKWVDAVAGNRDPRYQILRDEHLGEEKIRPIQDP